MLKWTQTNICRYILAVPLLCLVLGLGMSEMRYPISGIEPEEQDELVLLAQVIFGETEGEPFEGKLAVACVVRNRVKSKKFPDTYKAVLLQKAKDGKYQFSCLNPGTKRRAILKDVASYKDSLSWQESYTAAILVYHDRHKDITCGAIAYRTKKSAKKRNEFFDSLEVCAVIGNHIFYK